MTYVRQTPNRRTGGFRRWFARLLFLACIAVMGAVILSEPRMAEKTAAALDLLKEKLRRDKTTAPSDEADPSAPSESTAVPAAATDGEPAAPVVNAMPTNRVPVNRPDKN